MAVSGITQVSLAGNAHALGSFSHGSDLYLLWTTVATVTHRMLWWRKHGASVSEDIRASTSAPYRRPSAVVNKSGQVVVAYSETEDPAGSVKIAMFDLATGEAIREPFPICLGANPVMLTLPTPESYLDRITLAYITKSGVYLRESYDSGHTWSHARPALNAKVLETSRITTAPFDDTHMTLMQIGSDARALYEIAALARSRPVSFIRRADDDSRFYVSEAAHRVVATVEQISDNLRGRFAVLPDGSILKGSTVRVGTDDGISDFSVLYVGDNANPVVEASIATPVGTTPGADASRIVTNPLGAGPVVNDALAGEPAAITDACAGQGGYAYVCGYSDVSERGGLTVIRLADSVSAPVFTGLRARAVAAAGGLVAVAIQEGGVEKLRIYGENALAPNLLSTHVMPQRVNALALIMDSTTTGKIVVAHADRINIYRLAGTSRPIRLSYSFQILTRGSFHDIALTQSGFLVAAMGAGGVGILTLRGETLSQTLPSGVVAPLWTPGRVVQIGDLVRPTREHPFSGQRRYFRCSTAGTTHGAREPAWTAAATVADGSAVWTHAGDTDAVVTGVAVDERRCRIIAVGTAGGPSATAGRVWVLDARNGLPRDPSYNAVAKPGAVLDFTSVTEASPVEPDREIVNLAWRQPPRGAEEYRVYRSLDVMGLQYEAIADVPISVKRYEDALPKGYRRLYRVLAASRAGFSGDGDTIPVQTAAVRRELVRDANVLGLWPLERYADAPTRLERPVQPNNNADSWIERSITMPDAGSVEITYFHQGRSTYQTTRIFVDGVERVAINSDAGVIATNTQAIASGVHTLRLGYRRNSSNSYGWDTAYVTRVVFKRGNGTVIETHDFTTGQTVGAIPEGWNAGGAGNGWRITLGGIEGTPFLYAPQGVPRLAFVTGAAWPADVGSVWKGDDSAQWFQTATLDAATRTAICGEWTWEGWVALITLHSALRTIFCVGSPASDSSLMRLDVEANTGKLIVRWNPTGGTAESATFDSVVLAAGEAWRHFAIRKRFDINTNKYLIDVFLNGALVATKGPYTTPTNTLVSDAVVRIQRGPGSIDGAYCKVSQTRLSTVARTDLEIVQHYYRSLGYI